MVRSVWRRWTAAGAAVVALMAGGLACQHEVPDPTGTIIIPAPARAASAGNCWLQFLGKLKPVPGKEDVYTYVPPAKPGSGTACPGGIAVRLAAGEAVDWTVRYASVKAAMDRQRTEVARLMKREPIPALMHTTRLAGRIKVRVLNQEGSKRFPFWSYCLAEGTVGLVGQNQVGQLLLKQLDSQAGPDYMFCPNGTVFYEHDEYPDMPFATLDSR